MLVAALDRKALPPLSSEHRRDARLPYTTPFGVTVHVKHPGGTVGRYLVRPRNIARHGVGFLHGGFLHQDTFVVAALKTRAGKTVLRKGWVRFCRLIKGQVHEVGVMFEEPIEVEQFADPPELSEASTGSGRRFRGHTMVVEPDANSMAVLKFHLDELGVQTIETGDAPEALELAQVAAVDLLVVAEELPSMPGLDLIETLREEQYHGALALWVVDPSEAVRQQAAALDCEILLKPIDAEQVVALVERHLPRELSPQEATPLTSELWENAKMRPLIATYLKALEEQASQLERLLANEDAEAVVKLARRLRSTAGSYGYPMISEAASELEEALKEQAVESMSEAGAALVELCARACVTPRLGGEAAEASGDSGDSAEPASTPEEEGET